MAYPNCRSSRDASHGDREYSFSFSPSNNLTALRYSSSSSQRVRAGLWHKTVTRRPSRSLPSTMQMVTNMSRSCAFSMKKSAKILLKRLIRPHGKINRASGLCSANLTNPTLGGTTAAWPTLEVVDTDCTWSSLWRSLDNGVATTW